MIDFTSLLLGPVYAAFGCEAEFVTEDGATVSVTAIDKSSGVAVGTEAEVQTIRPAAVVRAADLEAAGVTAEDLNDASLTMNGKTWRVEACQPRPSPNGEGDGEVYAYLIEVAG